VYLEPKKKGKRKKKRVAKKLHVHAIKNAHGSSSQKYNLMPRQAIVNPLREENGDDDILTTAPSLLLES
jgi:hypothetical protein